MDKACGVTGGPRVVGGCQVTGGPRAQGRQPHQFKFEATKYKGVAYLRVKFEQIEFGRLNQKDLNDLDKGLDQMVILTTNQALIIFPLSDTK